MGKIYNKMRWFRRGSKSLDRLSRLPFLRKRSRTAKKDEE